MFARRYVVHSQQAEKYECSICFQIGYVTGRLTCACQKYICTRCIAPQSDCKICSEPIKIKGESIKMMFNCPSNYCRQHIASIFQFYQHCLACQYAHQAIKNEVSQIVKYQCFMNHPLKISNKYTICTICRQKTHCKSSCQECPTNNNYCIGCRPIPCTKQKCPTGHNITIDNRSATCDICGKQTSGYIGVAYSDIQCDLDICNSCYQELPSGKQQHRQMDIEQ